MSDTDSFIEEVTEEVRRDRLFALYRRYGWIGVVAILAIVGGVAFSEYRESREINAARALGDSLIAAQQTADAATRADALENVTAESPGGQAVTAFLTADARIQARDVAGAVAALNTVANDPEVPVIYRQMAAFKALLSQSETLDADARRTGFEALAVAGSSMRLLAEEQLALIEIETGQADAAITRLQAILQDAEVSGDLLQRAMQLIIALGGTPETGSGVEG